jgi:hypothetical protein
VELKDTFSIVSGVLGTIAFLWRVWDTITSHTQIDMEIQALAPDAPASLTALLSIENKGLTPKRIDYAVLMFGPANTGLRDMAGLVARKLIPGGKPKRSGGIASKLAIARKLKGTDSDLRTIFSLKVGEPYYDDVAKEVALIPVPFFYLDQIHIGNERLKYRLKIDVSRLKEESPYTVFFVIFAEHMPGFLRWRSTAELAVVTTAPKAALDSSAC